MPPTQTSTSHRVPPSWAGLSLRDLWRWPLDALPSALDRTVLRASAALARRQLRAIEHWERVLPEHDPFILVANHGSRRETLYLAAALMLARGGRPVHFLADWNFRLIPGVGYLYAHTGVISVLRKDARPRILNRLKPFFVDETPALEQARARLLTGRSIALFPEGTINRDPRRLLRGRYGAARLSLETGVPVVPLGIRFIGSPRNQARRASGLAMSMHIGSSLIPTPELTGGGLHERSLASVRAWHGQIMTAIAALCGKTWSAAAPEVSPDAARPALPATEPHPVHPGGPSC